jgi:carbamoyltransferase
MPFAPIVMEEHADTVFQISGSSYTAEFMTICYDTSPYWKDKIPAVVHEVDKTARPQIVNKDRNFHFWNILNRYHKRTGIPVLLNTSFNIHGESIINSPDKAMKHLDNGVVDVLVLEDVIYTKK